MLMSQAKIYWDLDNYAQVEKVNDKSALFWKLKLISCFFFLIKSSTTDKTFYMYLFSHYSHHLQAYK